MRMRTTSQCDDCERSDMRRQIRCSLFADLPVDRGCATNRAGVSLLEVLIALSIMLATILGCTQLLTIGGRAGAQAALQADGMRRCETRLAEIVAKRRFFESSKPIPFADDPQWTSSIDVEDGPVDGTQMLTVTVRRESSSGRGLVKVQLNRLVTNRRPAVPNERWWP